MKWLAVLALVMVPAGVAAAPVKKVAARPANWVNTVVATPEGGYRIGNPAAAVKLVEYGSLTCPHCAEFHEQAMATLKSKYVASGKVSFEFRNFVLNGPDMAASVLARCRGVAQALPTVAAMYTSQKTWVAPFSKIPDAEAARIQALPTDQQIGAIAAAGKLDAFVAPLGIDRARFNQCLADKPAQEKLVAMRKDATETWKLTGTPGFIINGKTQEGVFNWAALEPLLQAALR